MERWKMDGGKEGSEQTGEEAGFKKRRSFVLGVGSPYEGKCVSCRARQEQVRATGGRKAGRQVASAECISSFHTLTLHRC